MKKNQMQSIDARYHKIIGIIDHSDPPCCCDHPTAIGLAPLPGQLASWETFKGMHHRTCGTLQE